MTQQPGITADDAAIERLMQQTLDVVAASESSGALIDRAVIVVGLLSVAASLTVEDLAKRPGAFAVYLAALRRVVDIVVDAGPKTHFGAGYLPGSATATHLMN